VNTSRKFRFGAFEADPGNRELRKHGLRVRLQHKPFQILEMLLCAPGRLVMRNELARRLWPDLHVNFDRSLNTAVNVLRQALGDSRRNPRFIETRPGLGYRFIAPVEEVWVPPLAPEPPVKSKPAHTEAYQDYLKGRYFYNKRTDDDLHKSVAYFEAALSQDPDCAPAYAGLADTYCMFALLNMAPASQAYARAKQMALSALRLDAGLSEAHAALAAVKRLFECDWRGAEAEHTRSLELSAGGASAYGVFLSAAGKPEEALRELGRAREIDPLSLAVQVDTAWSLLPGGRFHARGGTILAGTGAGAEICRGAIHAGAGLRAVGHDRRGHRGAAQCAGLRGKPARRDGGAGARLLRRRETGRGAANGAGACRHGPAAVRFAVLVCGRPRGRRKPRKRAPVAGERPPGTRRVADVAARGAALHEPR